MDSPLYCSREDVLATMDSRPSRRVIKLIDRALRTATDEVEGCTKRKFYPYTDTRRFDWPYQYRSDAWRLWLDEDEMAEAPTTVTSGGVNITSDILARSGTDDPPFTFLELDIDSFSAFGQSSTGQRDVAVTGVFGYHNNTNAVGTLDASIASTSITSITVDSDVAVEVGVGDTIKIGSEWLFVTDRAMLDTTEDTTGALDASKATTTVGVDDGTAFAEGEVVLIDSERMRVDDIAGNNLIVERAVDGTVLASHSSGASVFASRTFTVTRGELGSSAATHSDNATVSKLRIPGLIREWAVAQAIATFQQGTSGYARTIGTGEAERETTGRGVKQIHDKAMIRYARRMRIGAI